MEKTVGLDRARGVRGPGDRRPKGCRPGRRGTGERGTLVLLAVSRFLAGAGVTAAWVAIMRLGYELSGTPSGTGSIMILSSLAAIVANLPAGALADRVSKRRLLLAARVITGVVLAGFVAAHRLGSLDFFYALVLAMGAAGSFFNAPFDAYIQELFSPPVLQTVNARLQSARNLSFFAGPALAGIAIALGLCDGLFVICASMAVASCAPLLALGCGGRAVTGGRTRSPSPGASPGRSGPGAGFVDDIRMGFAYSRGCPTCRFLLVFFSLFFGVYCLTSGVLMPYCQEVLRPRRGMEGPVIYSAIDAAVGLSGFLGAFLIPWMSRRLGLKGSLLLGAALSSVELLVMGFAPDAAVVVGTLFVTGISSPLLMVPLVTLVQRDVSPSYAGRVLNNIDTAVNAAALVACGLGALLAERVGVVQVFRLSGFMLVVLVPAVVLCMPDSARDKGGSREPRCRETPREGQKTPRDRIEAPRPLQG